MFSGGNLGCRAWTPLGALRPPLLAHGRLSPVAPLSPLASLLGRASPEGPVATIADGLSRIVALAIGQTSIRRALAEVAGGWSRRFGFLLVAVSPSRQIGVRISVVHTTSRPRTSTKRGVGEDWPSGGWIRKGRTRTGLANRAASICALRDATRTIDSDDPPAHPAAARARDAANLRRS
jgi:hypothetical protein